ncbi:50S ribosomal protein L30 [Aliicoccus persicus]|uniref:Large ribosomal subunit protein uL30 n=1 Tax=Aliicoccus persicus TaxID=930138 RepID=A0A662Z2P0_9STAP|nr:50S ribosomal protein L30 [Aliicoccus persicus]SEV96508.1 LSU ribosomal protein L30P [Aliicoccus persicus]HJE20064.1 50S ribosomal protein L30 [Aliicoccus persicus]
MAQIKVTLIKSVIGKPETQRKTVESLGFTKLNQTKVFEDTPQVRGQVNKVGHMLSVEEA